MAAQTVYPPVEPGKRYGCLTVISATQSRRDTRGKAIKTWLCRCDCGSTKAFLGIKLKSGRAASCGCAVRRYDSISPGDRVGKLTVLHEAERRRMPTGEPKRVWMCQCDCGETVEVFDQNLKRKSAKDCGCGRLKSPKTVPGSRYGRLVVIEEVPPHQRASRYRREWTCACDCGKSMNVNAASLRAGQITSCGCRKSEIISALKTTHGATRNARHNQPPEYVVWLRMRARCTATSNKDYPYYGGRGIKVCSRWMTGDGAKSGFECFLADMGPRPSPAHTIERVDNNGDYEPTNCVWLPRSRQSANRRGNIYVEVGGQTLCLSDAARAMGLPLSTVATRRRDGWADADLFLPKGSRRRITETA